MVVSWHINRLKIGVNYVSNMRLPRFLIKIYVSQVSLAWVSSLIDHTLSIAIRLWWLIFGVGAVIPDGPQRLSPHVCLILFLLDDIQSVETPSIHFGVAQHPYQFQWSPSKNIINIPMSEIYILFLLLLGSLVSNQIVNDDRPSNDFLNQQFSGKYMTQQPTVHLFITQNLYNYLDVSSGDIEMIMFNNLQINDTKGGINALFLRMFNPVYHDGKMAAVMFNLTDVKH